MASEATPCLSPKAGAPATWLDTSCAYVGSIQADLVPGGPLETVALIGRSQPRDSAVVVGVVVWSGEGASAVALGVYSVEPESGWSYALHSDDVIDLDGDGISEFGLRSGASAGTWFVRSTTWCRIGPAGVTDVYRLARQARTYDVRERRDMTLVSPGVLRERLERRPIIGGEEHPSADALIDIEYRIDPSTGRFAPVSTRVIR